MVISALEKKKAEKENRKFYHEMHKTNKVGKAGLPERG